MIDRGMKNEKCRCGNCNQVSGSIQFNSILLFTLYKLFTLYIVRQEYTNKGEEEGKKRKLMAWVEVYGGQRSLAFELTTSIL